MLKGLLYIRADAPPACPAGPAGVPGGGLFAFTKLNIEAYPNPAPVILEITAQAAGQSAEEMERYYTIPIEVGLAANARRGCHPLDLVLWPLLRSRHLQVRR